MAGGELGPAVAAEAAPHDWRARLLTPRAITLLAPLALLLLLAAWAALNATAAEGRLPRIAYLIGFGVPVSACLPLAVASWRHLFPAGRLARLPRWAATLLVLAAMPASCTWPLPYFFFKVVDPIGNRAELAVIRRGLMPLVEELRTDMRSGRPPEQLAPLLDRHFRSVPRWLRPVGAANGADVVRYFRGGDRFVVVVWGTPPHRDNTTLVVYTSWDDHWAWRDAWDASPDKGTANEGTSFFGLRAVQQEERCYPKGIREPPWECVSVIQKEGRP